MNSIIIQKGLFLFLLISALSVSQADSQTSFIWGKQSGTNKEEYVLNHVSDQNGNIYVSGKTTGAFDKQNFGRNDGFITKIDSLGNTIWSKQFGTTMEEDILWSSIDEKGCIYITGSTTGTLGDKNSGKEDVFVIKYNPAGQIVWTRQFGTDSTDVGRGIYCDGKGSVYVTGSTSGVMGKGSFGKSDGFIVKLDSEGNTIFAIQFGTSLDDYPYAITGDGNSKIFICGTTWGDIAGKNKGMIDAFAGSWNEKGEIIKLTQFGTDGFDIAEQLTIDDKMDIYVAGSTSGNMAGSQLGEGDCFLTKINSNGEIVWIKQFGTKNHDGARSIALNKKVSDNLLVSGIMNLPVSNGFIRMYKQDGTLLWERNFAPLGVNGGASGKDVSIDDHGNIYHLGLTGANLFGSLSGEHDFYLVKIALDRSLMNH
jgi:hypothetical protein